ncbi:SNARE-binding exocyst subunit S6 [Mycoemilia scoparia]|uniref:SNARE-binding exocyst subunit S6 n=1 Tax=Mycoemilia scoparia TaxID=417184 RepID=A0A9W7ZKM7_9FUNG|nr:SNARE-binding exocyst subunit S6 [Mycoemilia scoparia]
MDLEKSLNPRDIHQFAIQKVAKLLLNPDDLENNLIPIRNKLNQDKLLIDSQLKIDAQRLIDNVQEGLEKLGSTNHQMEKVKQDMHKAHILCYEAQSLISNYDRVKNISIAHRNFEQTETFYQQVQEFQDKWGYVSKLLNDAEARVLSSHSTANGSSGAPPGANFDINLLPIHYNLRKLEEFREKAGQYMQTDDFDVYSTLNMMFSELDKLVEQFDKFLWQGVASQLYEIVLNNRNHLVVQLVKIVEVEEKADYKLEKSKKRDERLEKHNDGSKRQVDGGSSALTFGGLASTSSSRNAGGRFGGSTGLGGDSEITQRKPKYYKAKLVDEIRSCVRRRMDAVFQEQDKADGVSGSKGVDVEKLKHMTQLVKEDLEFVQEEIVPCFPPSYDCFGVFSKEYHFLVTERTDPLVEQPGLLEGGDIVHLLQWSREHQMVMRKELRIPREHLESPPLLRGQEERLAQSLLDIICRNVDQWFRNDLAAKTRVFIERVEPPTVYYKYYTMNIPSIIFKIIREQVELIKDSNRAKLLCDFFSQIRILLGHNHQAWNRIMEEETERQIKKPDEVIPGLVDYAIALINDMYQCIQETDSLIKSLEGSLTRTYKERADTDLNGMSDDLNRVLQFCIECLVDIVYSDLGEVIDMLFTPAWYKDDLLHPVIKTLEDYCSDFEANLNKDLIPQLTNAMMERFVIEYLDSVHTNKKVTFKVNKAEAKIRDEVRMASRFFMKFVGRNAITEAFRPIEFLVSLIEQPPSVIVIEFLNVKNKFPDVPIAFIEDVLSRRSDASKSNFKAIIENLRGDSKNAANMIVVNPTIFSKLRSYK